MLSRLALSLTPVSKIGKMRSSSACENRGLSAAVNLLSALKQFPLIELISPLWAITRSG